MKIVATLSALLSKHDKRILSLLLVFSVIVSFIETFSITAIMLFISAATNFDQIFKNRYYFKIYTLLGCTSATQFVMILGIALACFYVLRGILSMLHVHLLSRFSFSRYHRLASLSFARFLRFPYQDFVNKNSVTFHQSIFLYTITLTQVIFALLMLASEVFTVMTIYLMLFFMHWKMTLILTIFMSIISFIIVKFFSKNISLAGKKTHKHAHESAKIFNESAGNYKLIKLSSHEVPTLERLSREIHGHSSGQITFTTLQNAPRFILETIGFLLLVTIILYVLYMHNNAALVIPIVSLYALAFFRLLPSMNKILANYNQVIFSQHALQGVYDFLHLPTESLGQKSLCFDREININNLSFGYVPGKLILHNINLTITKGERIAFTGASGSGKSTLIDVLMGLYTERSGDIVIDGKKLDNDHCISWRKKIGYIPQSIYLFDGTVGENVVFGREYNHDRLIQSLEQAHIYDFLKAQQGLQTLVGEGGIKLSGGQKQRIAIARALYGQPDLLVLDEATSALDNDTEAGIMDEIYKMSRSFTLVIIAHRLSTIARCDKIYKIENGSIHHVLFSDIMSQQPVTDLHSI